MNRKGKVLSLIVLGLFFLGAPFQAFSQNEDSVKVVALANTNLSKAKVLLHGYRGTGVHKEASLVVEGYIKELSQQIGFSLTETKGVSDFTLANLQKFDVVVFNYAFRMDQDLDSTQIKAFEDYIKGGGHWVGYHTAGTPREGDWDWFRKELLLGLYEGHEGSLKNGRMEKTENAGVAGHVIMTGLPDSYQLFDEWYDFNKGPFFDKAQVMYYTDESFFPTHTHTRLNVAQLALPIKLRHPNTWFSEDSVTGARMFYTALVHNKEGTSTNFFKLLVLRSLEYTAGIKDPIGIKKEAFLKGEKIKFFQGNGFIEIVSQVNETYRVILYNTLGKRVKRGEFKNNRLIRLSTVGLPLGVYQLQIKSISGAMVGHRVFVMD